jgi:hypothetical protein
MNKFYPKERPFPPRQESSQEVYSNINSDDDKSRSPFFLGIHPRNYPDPLLWAYNKVISPKMPYLRPEIRGQIVYPEAEKQPTVSFTSLDGKNVDDGYGFVSGVFKGGKRKTRRRGLYRKNKFKKSNLKKHFKKSKKK